MGQRLVIQIEENGVPLANAYYHWGAYTGSAIELTSDVLGSLIDANKDYTPTQKAVEALFASGARFYPDELEAVKRENINMAPYQFAFDERSVDRNNGLLSISVSGMENSLRWEEGHVSIDLATRDISFDVWGVYTPAEFLEYNEDMDENSIESLPELDCSYQLTFDTWATFADDIINILNCNEYCAISPDHTILYDFIA